MKLMKPILVILTCYLLIKFGVPFAGSQLHPGTWPVVPTSLMNMYMFFIVTGVILIYTYSGEGYDNVVGPILELYSNPAKGKMMYVTILLIGCLGAYLTYQNVKPSFEAPVELRSIHPAPPSNVKAFGKRYKLQTLKNPFRVEDKAQFAKNAEEGGIVYYKNCFFCHGDKMLGKGLFYAGLNPLPANFVDIGTIAQLTESFVFWRVSTGGPGLPSEGAPWASAMPVWHELISEEETWKVILFMYEYTGHHPRVTEEHH